MSASMQIVITFSKHRHVMKSFLSSLKSSALFPAHFTINGKDWTEILDKVPPAQVSDPALPLTVISTTLKTISKHGEDRKDLDDKKKLTINVSGLPNDIKKIYLQWQNKE